MTTDCYIFDLDGTICDGSHRLHHILGETRDWRAFFAACGDDKPIEHVIKLAGHLSAAGVAIVYVSGRSDECGSLTADWMHRHGLPQGPIFMRKAGDKRADDIVKAELLALVRRAGFAPIMVFDDRSRVVKMWRENGVPCAQVDEGDF